MKYSKKDIPELENDLEKVKKFASICDLENYHKVQYSNSAEREVIRLKKLIKLIRFTNTVEDYLSGLVLINDRFVVSLSNNTWRIIHKNKWYKHRDDIKHFVDKYICKRMVQ